MQVGKGLNARDLGLCTVKIDAGLSGVRSGSQIRGQSINCGTPSNVPAPFVCAGDCLDGDSDGTYAERSIPLAINGLYSGPGIGFASCVDDCDLIVFANGTISGLNNTCDSQLGLQMYSAYYSNVFCINGTQGLDMTTNTAVDGASFCHGANIFLNEGGGSWSCQVVTGVDFEQTKNGDGYVTNVSVTPKFGTIGGSSTCEPGDAGAANLPTETKKYWLTTVPCVTG